MLLNTASCSGTLNAGLYCVIVCYYQLEHDTVFGAIVDNLFRLEFLGTVNVQVVDLSSSEDGELFEKRER